MEDASRCLQHDPSSTREIEQPYSRPSGQRTFLDALVPHVPPVGTGTVHPMGSCVFKGRHVRKATRLTENS